MKLIKQEKVFIVKTDYSHDDWYQSITYQFNSIIDVIRFLNGERVKNIKGDYELYRDGEIVNHVYEETLYDIDFENDKEYETNDDYNWIVQNNKNLETKHSLNRYCLNPDYQYVMRKLHELDHSSWRLSTDGFDYTILYREIMVYNTACTDNVGILQVRTDDEFVVYLSKLAKYRINEEIKNLNSKLEVLNFNKMEVD